MDKKELAIWAFTIKNDIRGTVSGGIEAPLNMLSAEEKDDGTVLIKWKYPPTGGYSDCVYHCSDKSVHEDTYVFTDEGWLEVNGTPEDFGAKYGVIDKLVIDECGDSIRGFFEKLTASDDTIKKYLGSDIWSMLTGNLKRMKDAAAGVYRCKGTLIVITTHLDDSSGTADSYILSTGERFTGEAETPEEYQALYVEPVYIKDTRVEVPRMYWTDEQIISAAECNIKKMQSTKCSHCGKYHLTPYCSGFKHYDYCPHCGYKSK